MKFYKPFNHLDEMTIEEKVYPKASDFNSAQEYFNYISKSRDGCAQRGYHRVNSKPKEKDKVMICYDCDLWFDKEFAKDCNIKYKIKPL